MGSSTFNTCSNPGHDPLNECVTIIEHYKRPLVTFFENVLQCLTSRIR